MVNAKKILLKNFLKIAHVYNSDNRVNYMFSEFPGLLTKWLVVYWKSKCCLFFPYTKCCSYLFFERALFYLLTQSTQVFLCNKTMNVLFVTLILTKGNLSNGHNHFHNILSIKEKSSISSAYTCHVFSYSDVWRNEMNAS